jgi:hypothetical protein
MARGQLIEATKPVTSMPGHGEEHKLDGLDALSLYYGSVRLSAALSSPQYARLWLKLVALRLFAMFRHFHFVELDRCHLHDALELAIDRTFILCSVEMIAPI